MLNFGLGLLGSVLRLVRTLLWLGLIIVFWIVVGPVIFGFALILSIIFGFFYRSIKGR